MLIIDIPGYKKIEAEHLVLDYNGTLAIDGKLIDGVKPILERLSDQLTIHILTADTFGTSAHELSSFNCKLNILESFFQDEQKERYIVDLGKDKVIAIGNGMNDALMLKSAALGIILLQEEGTAVRALINADLVCRNITDALHLLENKLRITATLRS